MSDYFGQSPDGYQKPLYGASNLSDVVDKPAALINLGAASADDVLKAANPIGTIIAFYGSVAPYGYLPCSGQTVSNATFPSLVTFLGGTTSATLPDLRGEFLRGWDNGRGIDTGRAIRTWQKGTLVGADTTGSGDGFFILGLGATAATPISSFGIDTINTSDYPAQGPTLGSASTTTITSTVYGSSRPRNISVLYCIKAYDCPVNPALLNVATLASELGLKTALADFTGANQNLTASGYQKLPGGLIIQWTTVATAAGGLATGTWPIAFPTLCLQVVATQIFIGVPNAYCSVGTCTVSNYSVGSSAGTVAQTIRVLAVGS